MFSVAEGPFDWPLTGIFKETMFLLSLVQEIVILMSSFEHRITAQVFLSPCA